MISGRQLRKNQVGNRQRSDDLLHRRQLVAGAQHAEADRLPDLLDDLQIRRDTGAFEMELDHLGYFH